MRRLVMLGIAAIVLGFGVSSFAAESETVDLYAMSQLAGQPVLQTMSDQQLTSVEGMSFKRHHDCDCGKSSRSVRINQSNWMEQANVNLGGGHRNGQVNQLNEATQSNFALVR